MKVSTAPKKIDCAVIFAIEEEFNILKANKNIYLKDKKYFSFIFLDKNDIERECIATYMSEPGSHEAYKFLKTFYKDYDPHIQFIIGISGQISDDLKIGDICIANSVDKYDYNSKQKDGHYKFSGKNINLSFTEDIYSRLPNTANVIYNRWQENSKNHLNNIFSQVQIDELIGKHFIRKEKIPAYFFGKIVTGETVVDDPVLKKAIQDKDRKNLCVDMESYGFADANFENHKKPNLIIIRVVSDTADGRKKELDNFGNNSDTIRKWALQNAFGMFSDVLLKTVDFPKNQVIDQYKLLMSHQFTRFDNLVSQYGNELFERYSNLLKHIIKDTSFNHTNKQNLFEFISNSLEITPPHSTFVIQGFPGSGKTTLLYLLYKYLNVKGIPCNYINIHNYRDYTANQGIENFERAIRKLLEADNSIYLIIDGIDQFERLFLNTDVQIDKFWKDLINKSKAIVLGITLQDYENNDDETPQYYLPEPKLNIELKHFDFDVSHVDNLLEDLLFITELPNIKLQIIKLFIKEANLKEVDWFSTILIIKRISRFGQNKVNTLGKLFYSYSKEYFFKSTLPSPIREASNLTFKKFIKLEKLKDEEYKSPLWRFIQKSSSIKQFLISEHLVEKYSNLDDDFNNSIVDLKHVYSYSINSYFKDNINRNNKIQDKILQSVKKRYSQLELLSKPNICYIIGRLEDEGLKIDARKFLNHQLDQELNLYYDGSYLEDESAFRQHLLLIRTIFISLVYLQDKNASDRYLKFLLVDQEWDDLNRGFHLEYYGDKPYDSLKLGLHNDDLEINFPYTYAKLIKKIENYIKKPDNKLYLMGDIELQTITSLAVNRHLRNKLNNEIRTGIITILQQFMDNQIHLIKNIEFSPYIDFSLYILSKDNASILGVLRDINKIKKVKRAGWNFKGFRDGFEIERVVKDAESVPEHIVGAMIMAMLFLPEYLKNDDTYSKNDVIKTLLIHDLAEAFTGDIRTFEKTDSHRKNEDEIMKRMFAAQNIKGFTNLEGYKQLWDNYKSQNTTTAKVARELDKLEQLFQLDLYYLNTDNLISDYMKWRISNVKLIDSGIGKAILNIINFRELH